VPQTRLLTMSAPELDRLTVIERVGEGRLTQIEASKQLGITQRHLRRSIAAFQRDGAHTLVSKKRGMRSNRGCADSVKTWVIELVREHYVDFGPTLIAEKLVEKHDTVLSRETVRQWLMQAGIWRSRRQRQKGVEQAVVTPTAIGTFPTSAIDPERTCAPRTGMTNDWLKSQGLISVRDLWMKAHGYA